MQNQVLKPTNIALTGLLLLFQMTACRQETEQAPAAGPAGQPMVILVFDSLPPSARLPWDLEELSHLPLALGRLTDEPETDGFDVGIEMASSGIREGRLIASIDQPLPPAGSTRENISVVTGSDSLGNPIPCSTPGDIGPDLAGFDWGSLPDRNRAATLIFSKYLPDLLLLRCRTQSPDTVLIAAGIWFAAAESLGCCVAVVSTPRTGFYRGWFAIAGSGVRASRPEGITPTGLAATLKILSGLRWEPSVMEGVPAAEALRSAPWSSRKAEK
jgi:hypothetical protein